MPIINIHFVETFASPEQKQQLIVEMTDTFTKILGETVRPFTYVVLDEVTLYNWGIAGRAMPDVAWLTGPEYAAISERSKDIMRERLKEQKNKEEQKV